LLNNSKLYPFLSIDFWAFEIVPLIWFPHLGILAWCAEFLLEIDLKILLGKTGARLILKIDLVTLYIDPELETDVYRSNSQITCKIRIKHQIYVPPAPPPHPPTSKNLNDPWCVTGSSRF
jgi:hypothetical protein